MQRYGGCGLIPAGIYHQELPTTIFDRRVAADNLFGISSKYLIPGIRAVGALGRGKPWLFLWNRLAKPLGPSKPSQPQLL